MDFFDKLSQKASEAYKITADKTGKIAKETKLKLKMNDLKSQINDLYQEIGKKVYEKHNLGENIDIKSELEEECTKIDLLSAEIETCLNQCLELKDKKICEKCFKEIKKEMKFCPECGEKQKEEIDDETKDIENNNIDNEKEENTLQKTVEIESAPNIVEAEVVQEIKFDEEDKLD